MKKYNKCGSSVRADGILHTSRDGLAGCGVSEGYGESILYFALCLCPLCSLWQKFIDNKRKIDIL